MNVLLTGARVTLGRWLRRPHPADNRDADHHSNEPHIVIGGCGRSGTTLARVILDSHPRICCGPESRLFLPDRLNPFDLARAYKLAAPDVVDAYATSRSRGQFVDGFAQLCRRSTGKPRWAEKTPRNILHLDFILRTWPNCRFIHVLRDGRDVACSLRTHPRHRVVRGQLVPLNTWNPMDECIARWRDDILASKPYWSDPRVYVLRYEELVARPRPTIEKLLAFLDEPWDDALLNHTSAASQFRDPLMFPQNPEATQAISSDAVGRWQRDLSPEDKRTIKDLAGDLLVHFGYATDNDW